MSINIAFQEGTKLNKLLAIKHISSFDQIAQWLERVYGKHDVVGSNPTRANFLHGIEKP